MHVAFVIDNLGSGGAQRQAVELASWLNGQAGVTIGFAVYRRIDFFRPRLEEAGIRVDTLPKRGSLDPRFPSRLRAWITGREPDVVHAFLPMPSLWAALARRGVPPGSGPVWIAGERSAPSRHRGAWRTALRWSYHRFDAVTANSLSAAEELVGLYGLDRAAVHYLPNGIDLAAWDRRASHPTPFEPEPERLNVALVGRFSEEKNHRLLLAALARLTPEEQQRLCIWFVGGDHGPPGFRAKAREAIAAHDLAATVRLEPPTPDLPAFLARIDGLCSPPGSRGSPT